MVKSTLPEYAPILPQWQPENQLSTTLDDAEDLDATPGRWGWWTQTDSFLV